MGSVGFRSNPVNASRAVVLLSGGLDSATVLAEARAGEREVYALAFRYGQRHHLELNFARHQARAQGAHDYRELGLESLGELVAPATALVGASALEIPKDEGRVGTANEIPSTYVPARNTIFLAYGLAYAEVVGASEIWIGVNAVDYSGYPDCRPAFVQAFERLANLATRQGVEAPGSIRVQAPLLHLHKHEIITLGLSHGVDYASTVSCYDPTEVDGKVVACAACDSCRLRAQGFARAGRPDPAMQ